MSCIITYDKKGNKVGVEENNELFQQILSNPHVQSFDDAIEIFKQTYSDEVGINNTGKTQNFFSDVVKGVSDKYKAKDFWRPLIPFNQAQEAFKQVYDKFKGNFDDHIATSIPMFRETQIKVGTAITKMFSDNGKGQTQALKSVEEKYKEDHRFTAEAVYQKLDKDLFKKIADYHATVKDDRQNAEMKKSYDAFLNETLEQYKYLVEAGYVIEPWLKEGEPYGVDSDLLRKDIVENKHLFYLRSRSATGENDENETGDSYAPFKSSGVTINGEDVLFNDLFRACHDIFGHGMVHNTFSTQGEFDAYNTHSPMYSKQAQKALFLETVVYNAYYAENKKYAPRKIYDIPLEFLNATKMLVYDIGGSEGGFVKAITQTNNNIKSVNVDVNKDMMDAHNATPVEGSKAINEAFYEPYTDEDTGETFRAHVPTEKADVVHEAMVFQFITPERKDLIKEIKDRYLKEDGLILLEEKLVPETDEEWLANEKIKDDYKLQFYSQEEITRKEGEILAGMRKNQTSNTDLVNELNNNFKYVSQYWSAGNFKGYVATNSKEKLDSFNNNFGDKIVYDGINTGVITRGVDQVNGAVSKGQETDVASNDRTNRGGFGRTYIQTVGENQETGLDNFRLEQPQLKYQNSKEQTFNNYASALRTETNSGQIKVGVNTIDGFKELFSIESNTSLNSFGGAVNYLTKARLLNGENYTDVDGNVHLTVEGKNDAKKAINADSAKTTLQKALGRRSVTLMANNTIKVNQNRTQQQIQIGDKFVTPSELTKDFKTLTKEHGKDMAVSIITAQTLKEEDNKLDKEAIPQLAFTPENVLQEKLMGLLKKMGIKTLDFDTFIKNYKTKNGIPITASALADITNQIVAFRDGNISTEDLSEETSHFIVAMTPTAEKENLLRNIHKTVEWLQHSETYRQIYDGNEELVREEILGKVLANALQSRFNAETQANDTAKSIVQKLKDVFNNFFDKVNAYFQDSFRTELENYTQSVYNNLMNETLASQLDLKNSSTTASLLYNASPVATTLYLKSKKLLERAIAQQTELSKQYQSSSDKESLKRAKQTLDQQEENISQLEKIKSVSYIVRVMSSQANTLVKTVENKKEGFRFSSQEHNVYTNLVKYVRPSLLEIVNELDPKIKEEEILIAEIEKTLKEIDNLIKISSKNNDIAFKAIYQKVIDKSGMTLKDIENYKNIIEMSLRAGQADTTFMHAHLGSLLQAKNPILNLAGDIVERTNLEHISNFQKPWKQLMNGLEKLGFTSHTKLSKLYKDGYMINERDQSKVEAKDLREKSEIFNDVLKAEQKVGDYQTATEENVNDLLKRLRDDNTTEGVAIRTVYNQKWLEKTKERRESYFTKEFNDALKNHTVVINGESFSLDSISQDFKEASEVDKQYASERTQILINADGNLTKEDKARLQEINKRRTEDANPRSLDGNFKLGLTEVFDDNLGKYVVALKEGYENLPLTQLQQARTIVGLNMMSLVKQDFYSQDENKRPDGIPQKFIDELTSLPSEQERKEFLYDNAYVSFPDEYWNQLNNNTGIVENLRNQDSEEAEELIELIRKEQSIISNILKQNRVYNKPSETNFMEMNEVHQLSIKDAQTELDNLYTQARLLLKDSDVDNTVISESLVNDAYTNELENRQITSLNGELDFIEEHVTRNKKTNIVKARELVDKLKNKINANISPQLQTYLSVGMSDEKLEEGLLEYAKSNLLPYFKKTEPIGFSEAFNSMSVLEFIQNTDLVKVTPSFSYYEDFNKINPVWKQNQELGKEQFTKEYLDSVRDDEYYSYFDLDEDGNRKSNKNEKEWQARKLMLDYHDQMIDFNDLTGIQNRYMQPQVRRTNTERLTSTTINGLKESFNEIVTYRPEEQETGVDYDKNIGTSLLTIPTYYNRPLEDSRELTDNILYAYAMYGNAASLHKSRKENIGDMLVLEDTLLGVDFTKKESDATNAYKMLQAQLKANFYGVKETFSYEGTILGKKVDFGKLAKSFNSFSKFSNIAGLVVPITSAVQSSVQKRVEMIVGEVTNNSASKVANRIFLAHASESAKESMGQKLSSRGFINVIGESLGNYSITERVQHSKYGKAVRGVLKANHSTHQLGNFPVTSRAFLSVLADYRYVKGRLITQANYKKMPENIGKTNSEIVRDWEKYDVFIDDVIYATKEGFLDFENAEFLKRVSSKTTLQGEELVKDLLSKKEQMSQKALSFIQRIDSQIPEHQRSIAARNSISNFFLSHLNYLLVQIPLKVKSKHYNISEESWQEGNWATAYSFIGKMVKNSTNPTKFKEAWKESLGDDLIRKNLKRTAVELAIGNALVLMCMALAKYVDDDDDPAYVVTLADYIFTRVAVEQVGATLGLPKQVGNVIENPLMIYQKAKDLFNITDLWGGEDVQAGVYKGDSKASRFLSRQLPWIKEYYRFKDPKKAQNIYMFMNETKTDLFDSYAFASNLFDDE